jgi:flagellar hook assembly protein FlgD
VSGVEPPDLLPEPSGITRVGPNPFRRDTRVDFALPRPAGVTLRVFGPGGRLVATLTDAQLSAGRHSTTWTGNDDQGRPAPSGVYYLRLDIDGKNSTRQIVRLR